MRQIDYAQHPKDVSYLIDGTLELFPFPCEPLLSRLGLACLRFLSSEIVALSVWVWGICSDVGGLRPQTSCPLLRRARSRSVRLHSPFCSRAACGAAPRALRLPRGEEAHLGHERDFRGHYLLTQAAQYAIISQSVSASIASCHFARGLVLASPSALASPMIYLLMRACVLCRSQARREAWCM